MNLSTSNRYKFLPLPLPLLLGGPKERSDLPFRIPESIPYTEYFANPNLRQSLKYISSNHGRLDSGFDRFHEPLRARRSRFDRYACSPRTWGRNPRNIRFILATEGASFVHRFSDSDSDRCVTSCVEIRLVFTYRPCLPRYSDTVS